MALVKPAAPPGFVSQATQVQAKGGWYAGNLVRWRTGLLEKMGGWARLIEQALPSIVRRFHAWLDLGNRKNLLIACDDGVHLLVDNTLYALGRGLLMQGGFIPQLGATPAATLFSVALGSTTVTVKTPVNVEVGQSFFFDLPISIGGRIIQAGTYFAVKTSTAGTGFTFDMPLAALAAETDTYGIPLFTNDIVNMMTVTWKAHGLGVGSQIRIPRTTRLKIGVPGAWEQVDFAVLGGVSKSVVAVPDADHFTINMGPANPPPDIAANTGDGAGGPSHQVYLGSTIGLPTGGSIIAVPGSVIGVVVPEPLGNPQHKAWFLGNMGEKGLALQTGGHLEVYSPSVAANGPFLLPVGAGSPATAPQHSNGFIVAMPQAQVILFGTEVGDAADDGVTTIYGSGVVDPLLIRWSNVGSYDNYQLSVSTQAGSFRLSRGSRIVGMIQAPQATLILTDTDLWQMSYIGPPLIYGFTIMASGCGLVAPHAIGTLGRTTIWQGEKNFWSFDTGVQAVMCTVWDYIFEDLDRLNINKCHAACNSTTNELAFYFPSKQTQVGTLETNLLLNSQDFGEWDSVNVLATRLSKFQNFYLYEPQYLQSGWYDDVGLASVSWFDRDLGNKVENVIRAPDGSDSARALVEVPVNDAHYLWQTIDKNKERTTYTLSVYAQSSSNRNLTLRAANANGGAFATFNPATGALVATGVTTPLFAFIKAVAVDDDLGQGTPTWRRYTLTFTTDDTSSFSVFLQDTNGTALSYLGDASNYVLIWGAQLVLGGDPLPYERTGSIQRQNETRHYVKVNAAEGMAWDSGVLGRSAWLDVSVWGTPIGADITPLGPQLEDRFRRWDKEDLEPRNRIQQHEIGFDDDDDPMIGVYVETGYTELGDGTAIMLLDQCHPDMKWFGRNGGVKVSFRATNYPQGPNHLYGPFSITPGTQWFNPRVRARYASIRYDWEPVRGFSARVGAATYHVKPAGRLP